MDTQKVDLVIQYALAVAGEEDPGRQELGPIHLVKLVYLADLAHAAEHEGQTFSGADWRFHHFGPWSVEVWKRIEPAVQAIGATPRCFASQYQEDTVRWRAREAGLLERLGRLPWPVERTVRRGVREFGADTVSLLSWVYRTAPMLNAAPGERLDFTTAVEQRPVQSEPLGAGPAPLKPLSKTALKRLRAKIAEKAEVMRRERDRRLVAPVPAPRYDEVFLDGQAWLDTMAGEPLEPESGRATFSPEVWTSAARRDTKVS